LCQEILEKALDSYVLETTESSQKHLSVQEALAFRTDLATGTWDRLTKENLKHLESPKSQTSSVLAKTLILGEESSEQD